jgi:hypothetical protein
VLKRNINKNTLQRPSSVLKLFSTIDGDYFQGGTEGARTSERGKSKGARSRIEKEEREMSLSLEQRNQNPTVRTSNWSH